MTIVFFTGAGLSADSGIPTYRGPGGIYAGIPADSILSQKGLKNYPARVHEICDRRRVDLASVVPNRAHAMIAKCKQEFPDTIVITQNLDDLLDRAGCSDVLYVHGKLREMRSGHDEPDIVDIGYKAYWSGSPDVMPERGFRFLHEMDGSPYRPNIVLFDEDAPLYQNVFDIMANLTDRDVLVVIGTQGNLLPVGDFASNHSGFNILNYMHHSQWIDEEYFDKVIMKPADEAASEIYEMIKRNAI